MPFTRITLHQSYNDTQIMQISDILQQSLETEFAVPPHDRFQVFERLPANQHVFDRRYKSAGRSDSFIQFHLLAGKPRSLAQKDDVMVMMQFNTADEWSFSHGLLLSEEAL